MHHDRIKSLYGTIWHTRSAQNDSIHTSITTQSVEQYSCTEHSKFKIDKSTSRRMMAVNKSSSFLFIHICIGQNIKVKTYMFTISDLIVVNNNIPKTPVVSGLFKLFASVSQVSNKVEKYFITKQDCRIPRFKNTHRFMTYDI